MEADDDHHPGTYTERSPSLTINHLPDEWSKKPVLIFFIVLAHVCRKWRAVVLASASRLDLGVTVGPEKPDHIKTILSDSLPIFIDYDCPLGKITALWRMHAAFIHHDRAISPIDESGLLPASLASWDSFAPGNLLLCVKGAPDVLLSRLEATDP
ncbi:hypothetical protein DFH94DRAFT_698908 [Russula ochroleuca]|uniref:Uncharacterized protein n=1 Tax=Russula ochroleuca TaxID=152965 RepID=A0A9P5JVY4_9AGAM|nr:hypothetical protein DFH94DRAFT_698908 [Russula ochroleuca]